MSAPLRHPLLEACGVEHGFGVRGSPEPPDLRRPRQVHGAVAADAAECDASPPPEADAVWSRSPGVCVGVVTADCVPVLLAAGDGSAVAAVHAGWRGLSRGVIDAGVAALRAAAPGAPLVAAIGPHIGACCYEVDTPVLDALAARFGASLADAADRVRGDRAMLDLGALARESLRAAGLETGAIGALRGACTRCDPVRFHSYRRDGARSGRLLHYVTVAGQKG